MDLKEGQNEDIIIQTC